MTNTIPPSFWTEAQERDEEGASHLMWAMCECVPTPENQYASMHNV
jgi:hypothetical protein